MGTDNPLALRDRGGGTKIPHSIIACAPTFLTVSRREPLCVIQVVIAAAWLNLNSLIDKNGCLLLWAPCDISCAALVADKCKSSFICLGFSCSTLLFFSFFFSLLDNSWEIPARPLSSQSLFFTSLHLHTARKKGKSHVRLLPLTDKDVVVQLSQFTLSLMNNLGRCVNC